jgi:hypothetical protein
MFESLQAAFAEWGLFAAALACFAGAAAAFITIPVFGRWVAACLVALGCALLAYDLGYRARGELDNSSAIQAQLDEANRELAATRQVADATAAREKAANGFNAQQQDKINAYEATLKADSAAGGCALSDDDVRSLSDIGTGRAPQPAGAAVAVRPAGGNAAGH